MAWTQQTGFNGCSGANTEVPTIESGHNNNDKQGLDGKEMSQFKKATTLFQ